MTRIEKHYFRWLLSFICDNIQKSEYSMVLEDLFNKKFIWLLEYDENLAENGIGLREEFYESSETIQKLVGIYGEIEGECSVLEMMVRLAMDCEDIIMTDGENDNTSKWFWIMMENLGLDDYNNRSYDAENVDEILENFMRRRYDNYGNGNIFRFTGRVTGLKNMDIWMQLNQYLILECEK